ncbi:MAG TPA: efflux RND transporter periplasmic adaptor subunit [Vicinamibacteria bacterium]
MRTVTREKGALDDLRIDRDSAPHPPSRSWWWLAVLAALIVATGLGWWLTRSSPAEVVTAVAQEVEVGAGQTVLNASGYVTARRQATVSSKVTGKVMEVLIEEGMEVEQGQILARLDTTNVDANLRLAEAELRAAQTALEETRVQIHEAGLNLERTKSLVEDNVVSQAELDRVQAAADALEARLERQRQEEAVAEGRLAVWRQQLEDTIIRAPFDGVVTTKNAQPGEMISPVSAGGGFTRTGIGTVVDMGSLEVEVDVNESYIQRVEPAQRVEATLDAYPDWKIPSHVIAIVPTADRDRATVRVRIGFDELDPRILPDMGVKVAFQGDEAQRGSGGGVKIPKDAVTRDGARDVVFVVRDGRAERRAVTVGNIDGDAAVVLAGIAPGETVVVEGPDGLSDGDRVEERSR